VEDIVLQRMVGLTLCASVLLGGASLTLLAMQRIDPPPALIALVSASAGAIMSWFSPAGRRVGAGDRERG
jgi:hypothetical protein